MKQIFTGRPIRLIFGFLILVPSFLYPYFASAELPFYLATIGVLGGALLILDTKRLGLRIGVFDAAYGIALGVVTYLLAGAIIPHAVASQATDVQFVFIEDWVFRLQQFFQVFNEELVLRAMLLTAALSLFKKSWVSIFLVALVFSGSHFAIYSLIEPEALISGMTLVNLFLFALVCNYSYFTFGNIAYCLAIHGGWNLYRFSGELFQNNSTNPLVESETFNLIESSYWVTGLIGLSFVLIFLARSLKNTRYFRPSIQ
jgi:hypothetical protein